MRSNLPVLVAMALAPVVARATTSDKPLSFFVGGGASFPLSDSADRFDAGWNFTAGLAWNASARFGHPDHAGCGVLTASRKTSRSVAGGVAPTWRSMLAACPRWYVEWFTRWMSRSPSAYVCGSPLTFT